MEYSEEDNDKENEDNNLSILYNNNPNVVKVAKKTKELLKNDKYFNNLMNIHKKRYKKENVFEEKNMNIKNINNIADNNKYREENEESLSISSTKSEDYSSLDEDDEKSNIKTIFYPRPFLTFFLSKSTQNKFDDFVDRNTVSSKLNSLLDYADYSLFEMIVNKHLVKANKLSNFWANINYTYIEIINYIIIVVQNFLILFRFYKETNESYEEYHSFDEDRIHKLYHENMILAVVQIIFLGFFLIIWYFFKFLNSCQFNIMQEYHKSFVRKRKGENKKIPQTVVDYFQDKDISNTKFFKEVNKDLSKWEIFYAIVVSTHIMNREIIMLLLSLIFSIIFIGTKNPIFLVIQILFIINIISTLFDIILAIKLKWINIILLLLFDFLCIYIFMWFAFFYFPYFFEFDDVIIPASQESLTEGYCFSSVQCYLFILSRGSLSNGGISNDLGMVSYKKDAGLFIGRYFFDVIFFLLISLYISKMFLGFIIDTFGELRDINAQNMDDKENICFICQIERDECLKRNIDYDKHVDKVHNIWNYVYFLNYLYTNNSLNFNWIENSVWENLQEEGINWLPNKDD